ISQYKIHGENPSNRTDPEGPSILNKDWAIHFPKELQLSDIPDFVANYPQDQRCVDIIRNYLISYHPTCVSTTSKEAARSYPLLETSQYRENRITEPQVAMDMLARNYEQRGDYRTSQVLHYLSRELKTKIEGKDERGNVLGTPYSKMTTIPQRREVLYFVIGVSLHVLEMLKPENPVISAPCEKQGPYTTTPMQLLGSN
ncbi:MAG: hypothetical protein UT54_C0031G0009, partial [Candidatus Daviesbacteria bacterium GW2011_GWB1_39_5]